MEKSGSGTLCCAKTRASRLGEPRWQHHRSRIGKRAFYQSSRGFTTRVVLYAHTTTAQPLTVQRINPNHYKYYGIIRIPAVVCRAFRPRALRGERDVVVTVRVKISACARPPSLSGALSLVLSRFFTPRPGHRRQRAHLCTYFNTINGIISSAHD